MSTKSTSNECRGYRVTHSPSRRALLSIGPAAALGLGLPQFLHAQQAQDKQAQDRSANQLAPRGSFGSAKSVIFLFLHGGHPQHETWDPKPNAPEEVRGEFGEIATSLPGFRISELLPKCAELANRLTVIRTMAHDNPNHVQACLPAMTGHAHPTSVRGRGDFPPSDTDFPHFGAVLDHLRPAQNVPTWVQLGPTMTRNNGTVLHGQSPGFLGHGHTPLKVDADFTAARLEIDAISPRVEAARLVRRRELLASIDDQRRVLDQRAQQMKSEYYDRAFDLLTSSATRQAFDLSLEPEAGRTRYPDNHVGQACLIARRLVEAEVPFINVHYCKTPKGSWDTHGNNFRQMKDSLGPTLDASFSALLLDLEERGLLSQTLVFPMAEFGRTPKINKNAGRDHWPFVYSLAFAGAGLKPGVVLGRSDRIAAYPQTRPYSPAQMAATIYHLLGVPADTLLYDREQRPHRLMLADKIDSVLS